MDLAEEPCDDVSKNDTLVRFVIAGGCWNPCQVPEIAFPFVQAMILATGIEEKNVGIAVDKPAAVEALDALHTHRFEGASDVGVGWLLCFHLHGSGFV